MRLYDTHCHFESADPQVIESTLVRAKAAGVERLMAVGGSRELNAAALLAANIAAAGKAAKREDLPAVICALGHDRDQVGSASASDVCEIPPSSALRAWGEIGLDYHYSPETRDAQLKLFGAQLEEARRRDLPVVIHTREADDDTVALLREIPSRGIIHCYTGTPEYAKRFLDFGFYISFSGIVTFRAADNVRASVRVVPHDRLLIETDSPFLAPVPLRGRANEPAFLRHTCEFLAAFCKTDAEAFAEMTFSNAERILGKEEAET